MKLTQMVGAEKNNLRRGTSFKNMPNIDRKFYGHWKGLWARCNYKHQRGYKNYGERGIKCLWINFQSFKSDMYKSFVKSYIPGKYISIDRINSNGHYCRDNCRWVTDPRIQRLNSRRINMIEINGKARNLSYWLKKFNRCNATYYGRVKRGMTPEEALRTPSKFTKKSTFGEWARLERVE